MLDHHMCYDIVMSCSLNKSASLLN